MNSLAKSPLAHAPSLYLFNHDHRYVSVSPLMKTSYCKILQYLQTTEFSLPVYRSTTWSDGQRLSFSNFHHNKPQKKTWFPMSPYPGAKKKKQRKTETTLLHGDALGIQGESLGDLMCRIRGVVLPGFTGFFSVFNHPVSLAPCCEKSLIFCEFVKMQHAKKKLRDMPWYAYYLLPLQDWSTIVICSHALSCVIIILGWLP